MRKKLKSSEEDPFKVLTSQKMRKKHIFYVKENQRVFHFISMIVLSVASFFASIVLVPMLIFFSSTTIYTLVILVGLLFGFTFGFMFLDLQHLEHKHHIIMGIIVPGIAVLNIFLMMNLTKKIADFFLIDLQHNPMLVATFYLLGFILPYLFIGLAEYFKHKN
jgi:hypothetical protein